MKRTLASAIALFLVGVTSSALADLPPSPGEKFVGYQFSVKGGDKFPEYAVFAFPTSTSNGAPTAELAVVADGQPVPIGRRSAQPQIYAMKKAEFDAWKATYAPTRDFTDPAVEALIARPTVAKCNLAPKVETTLSDSDARDVVSEVFTVVSLGDKGCELAAGSSGGDPKTGEPNSPADGATAAPPPRSGGCAGCSVGGPAELGVSLAGIGLAIVALWKRRRS